MTFFANLWGKALTGAAILAAVAGLLLRALGNAKRSGRTEAEVEQQKEANDAAERMRRAEGEAPADRDGLVERLRKRKF